MLKAFEGYNCIVGPQTDCPATRPLHPAFPQFHQPGFMVWYQQEPFYLTLRDENLSLHSA